MRWLVAHPGPQYSVHDVFMGWVEGLKQAGEHVVTFDLDTRLAFYDNACLPLNDGGLRDVAEGQLKLKKALTSDQAIQLASNGLAGSLYRVRPDILFVISGFFIDYDVLDMARRYGTAVVILNTESPYEDKRQLDLAEHADLVLLNDPVHIEAFRQVTNTAYAPHAYRPSVHFADDRVKRVRDFSFVGTGYPSRVRFLEAMDLAGLDVSLAGNWFSLADDSPLRKYAPERLDVCLDNALAADLYRSTRVGMNLYRREADDEASLYGWAMGPREIEMAACGLFFLRDPRPESDAVLSMLPTFEGPQDATEKLRWYLARPDLCESLADAAMQAIGSRTFYESAIKLLRLFERRPVTISGG